MEPTVLSAELAPADEISKPVGRRWLALWFVIIALAYGLLWSPDWYPLSDSSLYLSLGRSIANGRGLTMMGDSVRLTPPLAPIIIAGIIKLGGGIGAIQAVMLVLMLVSHVFCFLALRRIVGERLALAATITAALSYWVYANAFTIMSEPPALAMLWAGAWILSTTRAGEPNDVRWRKVIIAAILFLGAAATRDAVIVLIPGFLLLIPGSTRPGFLIGTVSTLIAITLLGLWLPIQALRGKMGHAGYAGIALIQLAIVLGILLWKKRAVVARWFDQLRLPAARSEAMPQLLTVLAMLLMWVFLYRYPPSFMAPKVIARVATTQLATTTSTTNPTAVAPNVMGSITTGEGDDDTAVGEGRYKAKWLYGVKRDWHLVTEPPVLAGRWVAEGLAMPTVALFEFKHQFWATIGKIAGFFIWGFTVVGLAVMLRRGHWWLLGPALYFLAIWLQWGTRIKARYMIPVAPVLFLLLWAGLTALLAGKRARSAPDPANTPGGRRWALALAAMLVAANAIPWFVEFRLRHGDHGLTATGEPRDFHEVARRGAFSKLVDICAYLQKNAGPEEDVWMNAGAQRRIVYFMSGRPVQVKNVPARTWNEWNSALPPGDKGEKRAKALRDLRKNIPANARYVIVYADKPDGVTSWPGWHWPLTADPNPPEWWRLYLRPDPGANKWVEVAVPRSDHHYIRAVPRAGI